jgi:hypothetical protein
MLTAEIHEAIVYWTNPSIWRCIHNHRRGQSAKSYFTLEMEHDVQKLHRSELDAVMFLYQSAALMAAIDDSPVLGRRKMRLKRQALSTLRESLELAEITTTRESSINALMCLTIAALCEGEAQQVEIHGSQIRSMVQALEADGDSDSLAILTTRMCRVFFFDNFTALLAGRKIICSQDWLPTQMRSMIRAQEPTVNKLRGDSTMQSTPGAPFSQALIDVFHDWRTVLTVYGGPAAEKNNVDPVSAFYLSFGTSHRLFDQVVDILQQEVSRSRSPSRDPIQFQIRNAEVMLAATLLMQLSILQHIVQPVGEVCYSNGTIHLLRDLLRPTIANNRQTRVLQEAQLWALYACACWEITYLHNAPRGKWQPWFVGALRRKAIAMGIETWDQGQELFEQYWPTKLMAPDGAQWFDELLLEGHVQPQVRGRYGHCCWQPACALRPTSMPAATISE